jgi:hypothetical protein
LEQLFTPQKAPTQLQGTPPVPPVEVLPVEEVEPPELVLVVVPLAVPVPLVLVPVVPPVVVPVPVEVVVPAPPLVEEVMVAAVVLVAWGVPEPPQAASAKAINAECGIPSRPTCRIDALLGRDDRLKGANRQGERETSAVPPSGSRCSRPAGW